MLQIPSGKHGGKTFEEAHADLGYVNQMRNRRAVSAWVRSFQMYCKARWQINRDYAIKMKAEGIEVDLTELQTQLSKVTSESANQEPRPVSKPQSSAQGSQPKEDEQEEWITVGDKEKVPVESTRNTKRGNSNSKSSKMATEPNAARIQELRTQIAILERELAREVQIPEEEDI